MENKTNPEDHLKKFITNGDESEKQNQPVNNPNVQTFGPNTKQKVDFIEADSDYIEIPIKDLPFGKFYKMGTRIRIRPAKTKEIESFSIVNDKNPYDVQLKLFEMLNACVDFKHPDGTTGTARDIMDGDRDTIAILLSKLAKKTGIKLQKEAFCTCNGESNEPIAIDLIPANYVYAIENPKLSKFFDNEQCIYAFPLKNGDNVKLAPPTLGLAQDINAYIFMVAAQSQGKVVPNISLMKCLPYIKAGQGVKKMEIEQIKQEEFNYGKMNDERFMFIDDAVDMIRFGIEKIKGNCPKCGQEVHAPFSFPQGARALFIVPNAFDQFIG